MNKEDILETDVFDLLEKIPYVPSEEELAVEQFITDYQLESTLTDDVSVEALSLISDVYAGDLIEKARDVAASAKIRFRNGANVLGTFIRYIQRVATNRIVGEKFIRKRFDGLKTKYVNFFYSELADKQCYVIAPTYDTMSKRLTGIHNCVMYLKKCAESANPSDNISDETYAKLVNMSNGVFRLRSSASGLVNHLVWNAPKLEQFYLVNSPFSKIENIDNLCNSVLFVKYKTIEGVNETVKACLKRTKKLYDTADSFTSYEVEEDTVEQYMHDYGSAYMLSKMLKDIMKQGIQREVNTLAINYIHKLKTIRKDD